MTYDELVRALEQARSENARLVALLRECRDAIANLMLLVERR